MKECKREIVEIVHSFKEKVRRARVCLKWKSSKTHIWTLIKPARIASTPNKSFHTHTDILTHTHTQRRNQVHTHSASISDGSFARCNLVSIHLRKQLACSVDFLSRKFRLYTNIAVGTEIAVHSNFPPFHSFRPIPFFFFQNQWYRYNRRTPCVYVLYIHALKTNDGL